MKIKGKYHLTAAQKRHIRALIEQGKYSGQVGKKHRYWLEPDFKGGYIGTAQTREMDWGGLGPWVSEPFTVTQ